MNVTIDPDSGFCFGVTYAIEVAERELRKDEKLFCLGDIVHNQMEVDRLKDLGLIIVSHEEFKNLKDCKVLIRAHGEPPETYRIALENNVSLVDASCPIVLNLQSDILTGYREMEKRNGQIVIYGKKDHAEVIGLTGQTNGKAIVVKDEESLDQVDFSRPIRLYSQTTMSADGYHRIAGVIRDRVKNTAGNTIPDFSWKDSVCRQVSNRSEKLRQFASQFEIILFVSGKNSSNGMFLFEICKSTNPRTYIVSGTEEIKSEWFEGICNVGVCGATSAPRWLMEEVKNEVGRINLR
jgi:4-hydroxy-3-methylbut-2-en-1-yl diphosphate reductase